MNHYSESNSVTPTTGGEPQTLESKSQDSNTPTQNAATPETSPLSGFEKLGLIPSLLQVVREQGYATPTPIQSQAIPIILQGHDVMGGSQTGTGKTAAFALPLLQLLAPHATSAHSPARHPVRALILCPTRELAQQVEESIRIYGRHLPLRSVSIYGGVGMKGQTDALRQGREIIVATPGRLLDHIAQKSVLFSQVQLLILDEADRMLDMGFMPDVKRILSLLPANRQSLLFSATFSKEIQKLADSMLKNPRLIEVARRNALSDTVTHQMYRVSVHDKRALLSHLLSKEEQTIVFINTKFGASRLSLYLRRQGFAAEAIHGDKSQKQRDQVLADFKQGKVSVLVATDVAARGLDIDALPHVFNFDLSNNPEDYIHRTGRTGRAGRAGIAVSLVTPEDKVKLMDIEKLIARKLEVMPVDPMFSPPADAEFEVVKKGRAGNGERNRRPAGTDRNGHRGGRSAGQAHGGRRSRHLQRSPRTVEINEDNRGNVVPQTTGRSDGQINYGRAGHGQSAHARPHDGRANRRRRNSNERLDSRAGRGARDHTQQGRNNRPQQDRSRATQGFDYTQPYQSKASISTDAPRKHVRRRGEVPALLISPNNSK